MAAFSVLALGAAGCPDRTALETRRAVSTELAGLEEAEAVAKKHPRFEQYFYLGKAEVNRYALAQSRYGEQHRGDAVLIFVTEDFLTDAQVKLEQERDGRDAISVLKLNAYRRFYTGIYPYTVMTSVFTPARTSDPTLKLTFSATEWCGQVFTQLNRRDDGFHVDSHSYFQAEGDVREVLPGALLEDELMVLLRKDPSALPLGELSLYPSLTHARLRHQPLEVSKAHARLTDDDATRRTYHLSYANGRELSISFEARFPHRILGWRERVPGQPETTAELTRSIMLPYWQTNGADDGAYRAALGLSDG